MSLVIDMQGNAINSNNEFQKFTIKYRQNNAMLRKKEKQLQNLALDNMPQYQQQTVRPNIEHHLKSKYRSIAGSETARYSRGKQQESLRSKSISVRQTTKTVQDLKDIRKVPIQFTDDMPWAGLKGRIVYRGHTPKNSYYLIANLIQCQEDEPPDQSIRNAYQYDLQFNSKFESGNLEAALRVTKHQYWLFMREDTNSLGLRQWFFFEVVCNRSIAVSFRIYKFNKKYSLYKRGMKPYIKQIGQDWIQKGDDVRYEYDAQMKCYYLQFSYRFPKERTKIAVAGMPPYTYSRLARYISILSQNPLIKITTIGRSLGGIQIPVIQLALIKQRQTYEKGDKRKAILIMGRTHPAQTCSNFSIEVIVSNLLGSLALRQAFDFFIIPMVNPDGVVVGNHRTSLTGVDLNRKFTFNLKPTDKEMYPEVEAVKMFVRGLHKTHMIEMFIDLHGHSAKKNIFAYGQKEEIGSNNYLKSRVIPKLLSELLASFKYDNCVFQSYKQKLNTARVYFGKKYDFTTITIEQSYGLIDKTAISISDWRQFGQAFVSAILQYKTVYMENDVAMTEKLSEQIEGDSKKKKQALEKQEIMAKNSYSTIQRGTSFFVAEKLETQMKENKKANQSNEAGKEVQGSASELESGDEELENTDQGVQLLRAKLYAPIQANERQSLPLPDTSIQLEEFTKPRAGILHEHKMPMISRIMKMREKSKKSSQLIDILTRKAAKQESYSVRVRIRQHRIKLPNIDRFLV